MLHIYNGILFSLRQEGNPAIYDNWMNLENVMLSTISQNGGCEGLRDGGNGELLFNIYTVSVMQNNAF